MILYQKSLIDRGGYNISSIVRGSGHGECDQHLVDNN